MSIKPVKKITLLKLNTNRNRNILVFLLLFFCEYDMNSLLDTSGIIENEREVKEEEKYMKIWNICMLNLSVSPFAISHFHC